MLPDIRQYCALHTFQVVIYVYDLSRFWTSFNSDRVFLLLFDTLQCLFDVVERYGNRKLGNGIQQNVSDRTINIKTVNGETLKLNQTNFCKNFPYIKHVLCNFTIQSKVF